MIRVDMLFRNAVALIPPIGGPYNNDAAAMQLAPPDREATRVQGVSE